MLLTVEDMSILSIGGGGCGCWPMGANMGMLRLLKSVVKRRWRLARVSLDG